MKDDVNDIREIMTKYFAGEASAAEVKILHDWRHGSLANEVDFNKSQKLFEIASRHYSKPVAPQIDVEKEWLIFLDKVETETPVIPIRRTNNWLRVAAAILILIASSWLIYFYTARTETIRFEAFKENKTVTLPDGSTVILNRNSTISYQSDFGSDHRNVMLSGEAFFDVRKNPALPFIISARNAKVEVVGTSFNVLAYDSLENIEVVVKTGVVKLHMDKVQQSVKLTAGEKGVADSKRNLVVEQQNKDENYASWNTKELTFSEAPLSQVIETINKTFHSDIVLSGQISDSCLLTVSFKNQSLEAVLNVLQSTLNLTYQRVGNKIEITSAGC